MAAATSPSQEQVLSGISADDFAEIMQNTVQNAKTLSQLKGLSDEHMEAVYMAAYTAYNNGNYEKAQQVFQFLCQFDHLEKKYWMGLGACRQMLRQYADAIEAYSFAMLLDADDPRPPLQAADCHIALGNKDAAVSGLTAAIEWSGDDEQYRAIKQRAEALLDILHNAGEEKGRKPDTEGGS
ncbi:MAG: CesD/SycD/LcrH family type III secretion system chaperone [Sulfitobacter sp.]|nr:CesD/SycD/LcrH family type III secretion system chaperone [Sulfitobacter sp.]